MTTDKSRLTIWLRNRQALDDLTEELRRLADLDQRGTITRSTVVEGCVVMALADLRANGKDAAIYSQVTLPGTTKGSEHANSV